MKNKNILVITPIPSGMNAFFLEGIEEYNGMPAFKEVFLGLLEDDRLNKMYIQLLVDGKQMGNIVIPERYKDVIEFKCHFYDRAKPIRSILSLLNTIRKGAKIVRKENIYRIGAFRSHGSFVGGIIGKLTGVFNTRRIYGTFLINEIDSPLWKLLLKHPLEVLAYRIKGGSVLTTNDGTKGDIVFNKIGKKSVPFSFPLNGIDKEIANKLEKPTFNSPAEYMVYVARIVDWKRQLLLVKSLAILRETCDFPHCYIVGPVSDIAYLEKLKQLISTKNLIDKITIIPGLPTEQCNFMIKNSVVTFSVYHTSNLGNVFLESISLGAVMVAVNDTGSLNQFPNDIYIQVKSSEAKDISTAIEGVLNDPVKRKSISEKARKYSEEYILSWPERASLEIDALLS